MFMDSGKVKFQIKEYLTFSNGERTGIIVLISLIILVIALSSLMSHLVPNLPSNDTTKFDKEIRSFEKSSDSLKSTSFTINKPQYQTFNKKNTSRGESKTKISIELNKADSASLDQLPGIGPVFAKRIIKYRTILGGYYSVNQIAEVYGMKPDIVDKIQKFLTVDTSEIKKIDLNIAEFKEINAHPYISYEQTKVICKFRARNKLLSLKQLLDLNIFNSDELLKLRPYLLFSK